MGAHPTGFPADVAERVTIHHLLIGASGPDLPAEAGQPVFRSRAEVLGYYERRARPAAFPAFPV